MLAGVRQPDAQPYNETTPPSARPSPIRTGSATYNLLRYARVATRGAPAAEAGAFKAKDAPVVPQNRKNIVFFARFAFQKQKLVEG